MWRTKSPVIASLVQAMSSFKIDRDKMSSMQWEGGGPENYRQFLRDFWVIVPPMVTTQRTCSLVFDKVTTSPGRGTRLVCYSRYRSLGLRPDAIGSRHANTEIVCYGGVAQLLVLVNWPDCPTMARVFTGSLRF